MKTDFRFLTCAWLVALATLAGCSSKPSDADIRAAWLAEYGENYAVPADLTCQPNGPKVEAAGGVTRQPMTCTGSVNGAVSVRHLTVVVKDGKILVRDVQ